MRKHACFVIYVKDQKTKLIQSLQGCSSSREINVKLSMGLKHFFYSYKYVERQLNHSSALTFVNTFFKHLTVDAFSQSHTPQVHPKKCIHVHLIKSTN